MLTLFTAPPRLLHKILALGVRAAFLWGDRPIRKIIFLLWSVKRFVSLS